MNELTSDWMFWSRIEKMPLKTAYQAFRRINVFTLFIPHTDAQLNELRGCRPSGAPIRTLGLRINASVIHLQLRPWRHRSPSKPTLDRTRPPPPLRADANTSDCLRAASYSKQPVDLSDIWGLQSQGRIRLQKWVGVVAWPPSSLLSSLEFAVVFFVLAHCARLLEWSRGVRPKCGYNFRPSALVSDHAVPLHSLRLSRGVCAAQARPRPPGELLSVFASGNLVWCCLFQGGKKKSSTN